MKIPISLKRYSRLVDRSVNITVNSNLEVSSDQVAELDAHLESQGWLVLDEATLELGPVEPKSAGLTKSQQLRREIEQTWEYLDSTGRGNLDRESYYEMVMDRYIEHARSRRGV